jgi:hypothetical protein
MQVGDLEFGFDVYLIFNIRTNAIVFRLPVLHALVLMSRRRRKLLSHFVDSRVIFETTLVQWAQTVVSAFATAGLTHIEVSLVLI